MIKKLTGIIVSTSMEKTVVVKVERVFRHPFYKKVIKRHSKIMAHAETAYQVGDIVEIEQTRPVSKNKHFVVVKKLEIKE
ncbi:MAG: 30S ribosomal protein S17 [Candidatus Roizmanbacteria bacterium]|nr:30S ribosomal protein S17 [Candidatus Roizmanbacteria bacterium]